MHDVTSTSKAKHFLDTSAAYPMLLGSTMYKKYFQSIFGNEPCYVSSYVRMEFKRSHICHIIEFCLLLRLPNVDTIEDAFQIWSNRFKARELKAVLRLAGDLVANHSLASSDPRDKEKAVKVISSYVKRLEMKLRRSFKDTGIDSTRCARAAVKFDTQGSSSVELLQRFSRHFNDLESCRSMCRIDHFVLQRHRSEVETYIQRSTTLTSRGSKENKGFARVAESLEKVLDEGENVCSCKHCEKIGDAVIALDAPRNMLLEHTDHSFDHLCPPIGQPHRKHPSEQQIVKSGPSG